MESEREYMRRRASEEQAAADRASCDKARDLHRELAARYSDAAVARLAFVESEPETVHGLPLDFRILD